MSSKSKALSKYASDTVGKKGKYKGAGSTRFHNKILAEQSKKISEKYYR